MSKNYTWIEAMIESAQRTAEELLDALGVKVVYEGEGMRRRQVLVLVTQGPTMGSRVLGEELNGVDDPLAIAGYKQPKQALADGWRLCGPPVVYDDGSLHNGYEWYFEREEPEPELESEHGTDLARAREIIAGLQAETRNWAAAYREERIRREELECKLSADTARQPFADAFAVTVDGAVCMLAESEDDALAQRDRWRHERPEVINAVSVHMTIGRTLERDDA